MKKIPQNKPPKKRSDLNELAKSIVDQATSDEREAEKPSRNQNNRSDNNTQT